VSDRSEKTILLVEDDENDVFFMRRALQKAKVNVPLQVVMDGQSAVDYLEGKAEYADRTRYPLPALLLLDLKLPYLHGFDVLAWIGQQPALQGLPVVILTSSPEDRDRTRAKTLGARAYCVKPPSAEMVLEIVAPLVEELTGSPSMR